VGVILQLLFANNNVAAGRPNLLDWTSRAKSNIVSRNKVRSGHQSRRRRRLLIGPRRLTPIFVIAKTTR
jgi:hypothetical protein